MTTLSTNEVTEIVNRHLDLFVQYMENVHKTAIGDHVQKSICDFLYPVIERIRLKKIDTGYHIVGWNFKSDKVNLYYNRTEGLVLDNLYDQLDDALHHYFNLLYSKYKDLKNLENEECVIIIEPFFAIHKVSNKEYENYKNSESYSLNEKHIMELVRFHLLNGGYKDMGESKYNVMRAFVTEALRYIVKKDGYDLHYMDWKGNPIKFETLYHQAYNRIECYLLCGDVRGIYDLTPFYVTEPPTVPMDVVDETQEDGEIPRNESVTFDQSLLETLGKRFRGSCI